PSVGAPGGRALPKPVLAVSEIARLGRCQLLWLRNDPEIRLRRLPALWITLLRLLVRHWACDDDVLARQPVYWRSHLVLRSELERVDHSQHFVEVAAGGHRIDKDELDLLIWTDDVNVAHSSVIGGLTRFGVACGIGWKHPVQF